MGVVGRENRALAPSSAAAAAVDPTGDAGPSPPPPNPAPGAPATKLDTAPPNGVPCRPCLLPPPLSRSRSLSPAPFATPNTRTPPPPPTTPPPPSPAPADPPGVSASPTAAATAAIPFAIMACTLLLSAPGPGPLRSRGMRFCGMDSCRSSWPCRILSRRVVSTGACGGPLARPVLALPPAARRFSVILSLASATCRSACGAHSKQRMYAVKASVHLRY